MEETNHAVLTQRIPGKGVAFYRLEVEGEYPVAVFEARDALAAAEAHAAVMNLSPEYQAVEGPAEDIIEILGKLAPYMEYLVLNPPVAPMRNEDGEPLEVRLIPIRRFIA